MQTPPAIRRNLVQLNTPMRNPKRSRYSKEVIQNIKRIGQGKELTIPRSIPTSYNDKFTVVLNYMDNDRVSIPWNGTGSQRIWRMNSIFDPDYSGTGHQPQMHDFYATIYNYYSVLSCQYKIKIYNASYDPITFTEVGTSAQRPGCVNATFIATTNLNDIAGNQIFPVGELKNTKTKWLTPESTITFKGTLTPSDCTRDAIDGDGDETWIAMGANPLKQRYFGIRFTPAQWNSLAGASETGYSTLQMQISLKYTVQFAEVAQTVRGSSS